MTYATEDIITALKTAREAKGLSQRDLSARTGVPQSHISKIESGGTDIRLSSLIELARALDLDVKLVPRKATAAVDTVVRSTSPTIPTKKDALQARKEFERTLAAAKRAYTLHPEFTVLAGLQENLQSLKNLQSAGSQISANFTEVYKTYEPIRKQLEQIGKLADGVRIPTETVRAITEATERFARLRNQIAHGLPPVTLPRPAYHLDEDEEDDHA